MRKNGSKQRANGALNAARRPDRPRWSRFATRPSSIRAATSGLDGVSVAIDRGEFAFLVGPTGCGKSTFIRLLLREIEPVARPGADRRARHRRAAPQEGPKLRRNIGVVFQDYKLLPNRTVYDNVAYSLQVIGESRSTIKAKVPEILRLVGLSTKLNAYPDELSGGEQQRVSLARAFVNHRRCCSPTSRPATSTPRPRSGSCSCSTG